MALKGRMCPPKPLHIAHFPLEFQQPIIGESPMGLPCSFYPIPCGVSRPGGTGEKLADAVEGCTWLLGTFAFPSHVASAWLPRHRAGRAVASHRGHEYHWPRVTCTNQSSCTISIPIPILITLAIPKTIPISYQYQ